MTSLAGATAHAIASVDFPDRLVSLACQIAAPRQAIEQTFLDLGGRLSDCTRLLNEVSAAYGDIPAQLKSAEFMTGAQTLEMIREQVEKLAATHAAERDHIGRAIAMAESVAAPLSRLRRAIRMIRLIAVNARIVVATSHGQNGDFAALTADMTELGKSVEEAVNAFVSSYDRLTVNLAAARAANAAFTARHGNTLSKISGALGRHLEALTYHRTRAATKIDEHRQRADQIRKRVSMAVSALQFGDITRQRVEHIEYALEALAERLTAGASDALHLHGGTATVVCRLEAAQLDEALSQFDAQIGELAQSLHQLSADAAEVLQAANEEAEALLSNSGTTLAAIVDQLGRIDVMFEDFTRIRAELEKLTAGVVEALAVMVGHLDTIRQIEAQIHLLGLNTVIECLRLGDEGRALKVVAESLRELAAETVTTAGAIMSSLDEADAVTRLLAVDGAVGVAETATTLRKEAASALTSLNAVTERLRNCAADVAKNGPRAVSLLQEAFETVDRRHDFDDDWYGVRREIEALAFSCSGTSDPGDVDEAFIAQLRSRYTMDAERRLHDSLLGVPSEYVSRLASTQPGESLENVFL